MSARDLCRCGVYRYVHEDEPVQTGVACKRFRKATPPEVWLHRHSLAHHVGAWLWLKVPMKARWEVVYRIHKAVPDRCWCDLVDAAMAERELTGCLCDTRLPIPRLVEPGRCYCSPAEVQP